VGRRRSPAEVAVDSASPNMDVKAGSSDADLTAPLVSPEILSGFEALAEGRCSLADLQRAVVEVCRSDPDATDGVLQLLDRHASSSEFDRFDFCSLRRALEVQDPKCDSSSRLTTDQGSEKPAAAPVAEAKVLRGRYVLEAEIGRGGVGTVYRARDLNRADLPPQQQCVALKVLRDDIARRPQAVHSLRCEYHHAQSLAHPGIVNVFDFDQEGDVYFVTMELLAGESLGALIRRLLPNKFPLETAIGILRELGDAVAYAHEHGVLHLDLKPDNVMIDAQGHVRVLDFGLAQAYSPAVPVSEALSSSRGATLVYASCERLVHERPDVRDDIFSFACLTYELLSGRHPFDRHSALQARKEGREARRISSSSHSQWDALKSGLAWERQDRPENMRQLLKGLELQSRVAPRTARPPAGWQPVAAVALLVLGVAALLIWDWTQDSVRRSVDARASAIGRNPAALRRAAREPKRNGSIHVRPASRVPSLPDGAPAIDTERAAAPLSSLAAQAHGRVAADPSSLQMDVSIPPPVERSGNKRASTLHSSPLRKVARADWTFSAAARSPPEVPEVLGFSRHSFSVSEAAPAAHLIVRRLGSAADDISFQWYTVDQSARAAFDYVFEFGEERMAPGQTTTTLNVPIVEDATPEDPELLQVVIVNSHGARVGPAGRVPVIIVDDD
jgi:serine/threonine protein kinase